MIDVNKIPKEDIKSRECKFATYCPNKETGEDLHVIKEVIHLKDGTSIPNLKMVKNFKRPFWVTRKGYQNHKDKKEWEDEDRLTRYESSQVRLQQAVAKALGTPWVRGSLRDLAASPYLYGTDISSTAVIKKKYQDTYPDSFSRFKIAAFDIETDMINGDERAIMGSLTFKDKIYTAITKDYLKGIADAIPRLHELLNEHLKDYIKTRGLKFEIEIVNNDLDVFKRCFAKAHEWGPDFVTVWNLDFEMTKFEQSLAYHQADPLPIVCDPSVPEEYRSFRYIRGKNKKVTASGKVIPVRPANRWHTALFPAKWYLIDSMCAYRHLRLSKPEEPDYSLDAILQKHLNLTKLKFPEADKYEGERWHEFMQSNMKLPYIVYNIFDCIALELLDEKIDDLNINLPTANEHSDFESFKSQPKRTIDDMHYFVQSHKKVIASTSSDMGDGFDDETVDLRGWIVTLPAYMVHDNGLACIKEDPGYKTNIRTFSADLDVAASYPNGELCFNISKETTLKELVEIHGVDADIVKMNTINLSGGFTNAVEFCTSTLHAPTLFDLLKEYNKEYKPAF